jgi:hypothetical protein
MHAQYALPRVVEHHLCTQIARFLETGILEEDHTS